MLIERTKSTLLLIDVQEKLTPRVQNSAVLIKRCHWLLQLAYDLQVPCIINEQYPSGLGHTVEPLKKEPYIGICIEKICFSSWKSPQFLNHLKQSDKNQMILTGIETHVCVLQTAIDLKEAGHAVFVVVDAVASRSLIDHKYALKRMNQQGIQLVTSEMVFFEWIGQAGTPEFKSLSKKYLMEKTT